MTEFEEFETRLAGELHGAYRRGLFYGLAAGFGAGALAFGLWLVSRWPA